jgi:isopenicillin-N epimerase
MTPKGSGFLYVRPELQRLINPLVISHGWTEDAAQPGARGAYGGTPFLDGLQMRGTRDPSAWLSVPAALKFREEHDWPSVAGWCQSLARETARRLVAVTGFPLLAADAFLAPQMVAIQLPDTDPEVLKSYLLDRHTIEVPVFNWDGRSILRFSVQYYNTEAHMNALVDAVASYLREQRKAS